jgi:CRISPR system Cascade subunit CasC
MTHFLQIHALMTMPPSNPNRDDQGRPKTASFGGVQRLRYSSQSVKRALRTSTIMQSELEGYLGTRTQRLGEEAIEPALIEAGASTEEARKIATEIMDVFGKTYAASAADKAKNGKGKGKAKAKAVEADTDAETGEETAEKPEKEVVESRTKQLVFVSPEERTKAIELALKRLKGEEMPGSKNGMEKVLLMEADTAVDIGMFGRMLADSPRYNRIAAVQVNHPITTHKAVVEDDFYVAVDDLKRSSEDVGGGFLGDAGFGSGVFYTYVNIDLGQLERNLGGENKDLVRKGVKALVKALAVTTPGGKVASFAHHGRAIYMRAEFGTQQPRTLEGAFVRPVQGDDIEGASVAALEDLAAKFDHSYGPQADQVEIMDVHRQQGSLAGIEAFIDRVLK